MLTLPPASPTVLLFEDAPIFRLTAHLLGLPGGDTPAVPGITIAPLRSTTAPLDVTLPDVPGRPPLLLPPSCLQPGDILTAVPNTQPLPILGAFT